MALEIKTTRGADGAMATHTPGAAGYGNPYGDLFASLIRQKMANQSAKAAPAMPEAPQVAYRQAEPERKAPPPTMGSSPTNPSQKVLATRMRNIPQNPYDSMSRIPGGIGGTGHTNTARAERFIEGVGWEFDGLPDYDQKGGTGGFSGGGALSTLHAGENLGLPGPANPIEANRDDYKPEKGRMPLRAPIDPLNRNNDSRGRGFGMDYGRR